MFVALLFSNEATVNTKSLEPPKDEPGIVMVLVATNPVPP